MRRRPLLLAALLPIVQAGMSAGRAADVPADPGSLLRAWAAAYATPNDGARCVILYTEDARLWGSVSREQTVGRADITIYFGRVRPVAGSVA